MEIPSNADPRTERARVRRRLGDADGTGPDTARRADAARDAAAVRALEEGRDAAELSRLAAIRPDGIVYLRADRLRPSALSRVIQAASGAEYPAAPGKVAALAASLRPATLGGARLLPAGALGPGWLVVREAASMAPPVPAAPGAAWDGRFRLEFVPFAGPGLTLGPLGADAAGLRRLSDLPAAALHTLPALRRGGAVLAVPHLGFPDTDTAAQALLRFAPARPVTESGFVPA